MSFKRAQELSKNIFIAVDQFLNAITGGDPDETISSRAEKARQKSKKWGCVLCKILDAVDSNHCAKSLEADEGKRSLRERSKNENG